MRKIARIQYISSGQTKNEQIKNIRQALDYGAEWIQLRWKEGSKFELFHLAEEVRLLSRGYGARLMINDFAELAKHIDADGLHLGLKDGPVEKARALLGPGKIIGGTANRVEDILQRIQEGCDYIGLGPLRYTRTKTKLSPVLGHQGYREITARLVQESHVFPPLIAIGGVRQEDISELCQTGVYGVAVSSQINLNPQSLISIKQQYDNCIKHSK